jgi:hypothetical protein
MMADQTSPSAAAAQAAGDNGFVESLPIHLVDLGKAKSKAIKELKNGGGKLHVALIEALEEVEAHLGEVARGKTVLPIVLVVEKRKKQRSPFNIL